MAWFKDKTHYNRADALEAASKAQGAGKKKKAIVEYRKVLEHEPGNAAVLSKLGVLLAETRQLPDAWKAFVAAAESWKKQGFVDKRYAVYQQAASYMPLEVELWEALARIDVERGRRPDAVNTLLEGRSHFRKRKYRSLAIRLLRAALKIDDEHFDAAFGLAKLLRKTGGRAEARRILDKLAMANTAAPRSKAGTNAKKRLRRVRGSLFIMGPTPAAAWRWTRAALRGR
jgi:tetratricopeptide (TPR) repeat protein